MAKATKAKSKSKKTVPSKTKKRAAATAKKKPVVKKKAATKKKVAPKKKAAVKKKTAVKKKVVAKKAAAKKAATKKAPAAKKAPAKKAEPKPVAPPPPPKPKKEKEGPLLFKANEHVVYPTHGVGLVTGIETQVIAGHKLRLYVIDFDDNRMTLRVPTGKALGSGLRKISSKKIMDNAVATLKGRARIKRTMWSRRAQEYEAKINSGDPLAIAEVVRDLHRNADQPDQSFSERQIYEAALERLVNEVAAVEKTDKEKAQTKLEALLVKTTPPASAPAPVTPPSEST